MSLTKPSFVEEALADLCHKQWSGWMEYLFTKGHFNEDGSFTINTESTQRWVGQMETDYNDLSEKEKESDRIEARKFMKLGDLYNICTEETLV